MRILVTGGAGFIGSHIVDRFITAGHDVAVIDNLSTGRREYVNSKAKLYEIDIRNRNAVQEVIVRVKPEVLNHHAAQMDVRRSVADPVYDASINIIGLLNLMEECRLKDIKQVIFASSGGTVYGETDVLPTPEDQPLRPTSPYGVAKLTSELYLDYYAKMYAIPFISLRYGNVYGPRQNPHGEAGVVAIFIQKLLKGEQPIINGDGKQTRDFIFVEDIVEANVAALGRTDSNKINIGTGFETDINMIFTKLASLAQKQLLPQYGPAKSGEQRRSVLNIQKAVRDLGWKPRYSMDEGLQKTVAYFPHSSNPDKNDR